MITTILNASMGVLVLAVLTDSTPLQKLELVCVVVGLDVILADIGWYREQDRQDDLVTLGLIFGSILWQSR